MDIAVAYIIQIVWFDDIPLWTSILGAFVVILAVFTMSLEDAFLAMLKSIFGTSGWCWLLSQSHSMKLNAILNDTKMYFSNCIYSLTKYISNYGISAVHILTSILKLNSVDSTFFNCINCLEPFKYGMCEDIQKKRDQIPCKITETVQCPDEHLYRIFQRYIDWCRYKFNNIRTVLLHNLRAMKDI